MIPVMLALGQTRRRFGRVGFFGEESPAVLVHLPRLSFNTTTKVKGGLLLDRRRVKGGDSGRRGAWQDCREPVD